MLNYMSSCTLPSPQTGLCAPLGHSEKDVRPGGVPRPRLLCPGPCQCTLGNRKTPGDTGASVDEGVWRLKVWRGVEVNEGTSK